MNEPTLFDAPVEVVTLPGIEHRAHSRLVLKRGGWVKRQRKCRASKRMAANTARLEAQKRAREEVVPAPVPRVDFEDKSDDAILRWAAARTRIWGAVLLGGSLAGCAFERVEPELLDYPENVIFRVARDLWRSGIRVSGASVGAELKRRHLIVPGGVAWLDEVLASPTVPRELRAALVEEDARVLKRA